MRDWTKIQPIGLSYMFITFKPIFVILILLTVDLVSPFSILEFSDSRVEFACQEHSSRIDRLYII